jgi:hypothetical protein
MLGFVKNSVALCTLGSAFVACAPSHEVLGQEPIVTQQATAPGEGQVSPKEGRWTPDQGLVVHEWGTFTTFSGSDGAFLEFRPLANQTNDLPNFVWNRMTATNNPTWFKGNMRAKVRMETPVLYFYTAETQDMDVKVDFPQGMLTEFYPPVQRMLPKLNRDAALHDGERIGNSSLDWGRVTLMPVDQLGPQIADPARRRQLQALIERELVPQAPGDDHYAKARNTDSALVFVHAQDKAAEPNVVPERIGFAEKFLFYRGVGKFELPIQVSFDAKQRPILSNQVSKSVVSALMMTVRDGQIQASEMFQVAPGEKQPIRPMQSTSKEDVMRSIESMLIADGLYAKEAAAMVATWEDSWFTEEGTRVLYIVPRSITDELLPLHLNPQPQQLVRTLVGRLEILSPDDEEEAKLAVEFSLANRLAIAESQSSEEITVPASILRFGRMAEPTLARVAALSSNQQIRFEAECLMAQLRKQASGQ